MCTTYRLLHPESETLNLGKSIGLTCFIILKYFSRLLLTGCLLLPFFVTSYSKDGDEEEITEIVDSSQNNDSKEGQQTTNKKPVIRSLKLSVKKNGSKVSSSVGINATIQVENPADAPVTNVSISCEGKTASARYSMGYYTASLTVPGKAYGTTYTVKATATNKYGSYTSNTSFKRP